MRPCRRPTPVDIGAEHDGAERAHQEADREGGEGLGGGRRTRCPTGRMPARSRPRRRRRRRSRTVRGSCRRRPGNTLPMRRFRSSRVRLIVRSSLREPMSGLFVVRRSKVTGDARPSTIPSRALRELSFIETSTRTRQGPDGRGPQPTLHRPPRRAARPVPDVPAVRVHLGSRHRSLSRLRGSAPPTRGPTPRGAAAVAHRMSRHDPIADDVETLRAVVLVPVPSRPSTTTSSRTPSSSSSCSRSAAPRPPCWSRWRARSSWRRPSSCRASAANGPDRYDKAWVAQKLKLFEIAAALFSVLGFLLVSLPLLFTALVLFSTVAALFSPVKYGMLPDQLRQEELPTGNALVEGGTFIAILLGTDRGRLGRRRRSRPDLRPCGVGLRGAVLGGEPADPRHERGRPRPRRGPEHLPLHRPTGEAPARRPSPVVLRTLRQLVLADRRGGADAAADPGQGGFPRQRGLHHGGAGDLLHRHRGRLGTGVLAVGGGASSCCPPPSRPCCSGCSRSTSAGCRPHFLVDGTLSAEDLLSRSDGLRAALRPLHDRDLGRALHRAGLHGRAGVEHRRGPGAQHRRRQHLVGRLHGGGGRFATAVCCRR